MRSRSRRAQDALIALVPGVTTGYLFFSVSPSLGQLFGVSLASRLLLTLASSVIAVVLIAVLWILRNPIPHVNFATDKFRIRGRTIDITSIDSALMVLVPSPALTKPGSTRFGGIRIGIRGGPQITIAFGGGTDAGDREYRERLAEVIRRSSIRYPSDPYDPTGKFASYNFPENLDEQGALDFVLGSGTTSTEGDR